MNTQKKEKIKILIADDHPIFRKGLRYALSDISEMEIIDEVASCQQLLQKIEDKKFSIVLLDVSMGGQNSLDTLKQIKINRPKLPILVLSVYPEDNFAIRFIKAGAAGYLTKEQDPEVLMEAIRRVASGQRFTSRALTEKLAFGFSDQNKLLHEYLSDREYQVFNMIVQGKALTKIAEELGLSVKTIGTHRKHILEKMKMRNNAQLIQYAIINKLI